jgi:hypothetical protein
LEKIITSSAYKRQSKRPVQSDTLSGQFCKTFGKSFINKLKRDSKGNKLYACFVDFKRASDTLIHPPMLIRYASIIFGVMNISRFMHRYNVPFTP